MCGVVGYWMAREGRARPDLDKALSRLAHRGPNDRGIERYVGSWGEIGLGHTRLSIIDLSLGGRAA